MNLLAFSDVHGNGDVIKTLVNNVKQKEYDAIIFAGDFTSYENVQELYEEIMKELLTLQTPIYYVFGNRDFPPPKPTFPTLLRKGSKIKIGDNLFITTDQKLVN